MDESRYILEFTHGEVLVVLTTLALARRHPEYMRDLGKAGSMLANFESAFNKLNSPDKETSEEE